MTRILFHQGIERLHPLVVHRSIPVDSLHGVLNPIEICNIVRPLLIFLIFINQNLVGIVATESSQYIKPLWQCTHGNRMGRNINKFLKYLIVGKIPLRHKVNLILARNKLLWRNAVLLVCNLLYYRAILLKFRSIAYNLFGCQVRLCHFLRKLHYRHIVRLSNYESNRFNYTFVPFLQVGTLPDDIGVDDSPAELHIIIQTERNILEPHHRLKVTLESIVASVVTTRAEQTIHKWCFMIFKKI